MKKLLLAFFYPCLTNVIEISKRISHGYFAANFVLKQKTQFIFILLHQSYKNNEIKKLPIPSFSKKLIVSKLIKFNEFE